MESDERSTTSEQLSWTRRFGWKACDSFRPGHGVQVAYSQSTFMWTVTLYVWDSYNIAMFPK